MIKKKDLIRIPILESPFFIYKNLQNNKTIPSKKCIQRQLKKHNVF